jgi:hypothetical protein
MTPLQDIAAVLVTRGNVDMTRIVESLPYDEIVIWDNSTRPYNLGVLGRWAAIAETTKPVIFVQDDDCIVQTRGHEWLRQEYAPGVLTGIMPCDHAVGEAHCLVGWGAMFDRDLPEHAFARWLKGGGSVRDMCMGHPDIIVGTLAPFKRLLAEPEREWHRTMQTLPGYPIPTTVQALPYMLAPDRMHNADPKHNVDRGRIHRQALQIMKEEA